MRWLPRYSTETVLEVSNAPPIIKAHSLFWLLWVAECWRAPLMLMTPPPSSASITHALLVLPLAPSSPVLTTSMHLLCVMSWEQWTRNIWSLPSNPSSMKKNTYCLNQQQNGCSLKITMMSFCPLNILKWQCFHMSNLRQEYIKGKIIYKEEQWKWKKKSQYSPM